MAEAIRESQPASGKTYDVFISHAGAQKGNFAVWLQRELRRHGVSAFLDERSLRLGDAADAEMEAALRSCRVVVVVLTHDFLRSAYCLEELHWALHPSQPHPAHPQAPAAPADTQPAANFDAPQQRSRQPLTVMPVFYNTSDIGALQKQLLQWNTWTWFCGMGELKQLRQASSDLNAICRITGDRLDLLGKLDDVHVDAIVAEVLRRLDQAAFEAPTYAVELDSRVQALLPLLQPDQQGGVRVLSLHGMGGIGKTTLARQLFSRLSSGGLRFSSRIFLEVGQTTQMQDKQRQLLQMLAGSDKSHAGITIPLQQQLQRCTQNAGALLLVLDDIWEIGQRDALLCLDALPDGSRVILTGRDSSKLHPDGGGCLLRAVEELERGVAAQLLCQHAFAAKVAPPEYAAAVEHALAVCGGLPLALQVVGAGMRSRTPEEAGDGVKHLLAEPCASVGRTDATGKALDVLTLLRWSFDRLPTNNHRHFFLDAALLMRGRPQVDLLQAWAGVLQQQEEDDDGVQHRSSLEALRRRATMLWAGCAGAALVGCDCSAMKSSRRVQVHDCIVEMAEAIRREYEHAGWSLCSYSPTTELPQDASVTAHASRLRCGPPGAVGILPCYLSELLDRHQRCQLAAVDLPHLDAAGSALTATPSRLLYVRLAAAPNHWAFGGRLLVLDVRCTLGAVGSLDSIAACSSLRSLRLADLRQLPLPASLGSLTHLETLVLTDTSLTELPASISCLLRLRHLHLRSWHRLQWLPDGIGNLCSLQELDVSNCRALLQLPDSIGGLYGLQQLDVGWCTALHRLPGSISSLSNLKSLGISACEALQMLPDSIISRMRLGRLSIDGYRAFWRRTVQAEAMGHI